MYRSRRRGRGRRRGYSSRSARLGRRGGIRL